MSSKTALVPNSELEEYITEFCQKGPWEVHSILPATTVKQTSTNGSIVYRVIRWQVVLTANISKGVGALRDMSPIPPKTMRCPACGLTLVVPRADSPVYHEDCPRTPNTKMVEVKKP